MSGIVNIPLSQRDTLLGQGYEVLKSGDASKANCDGFQILIKRREGYSDEIKILCPTFLRGPIGFKSMGGISY